MNLSLFLIVFMLIFFVRDHFLNSNRNQNTIIWTLDLLENKVIQIIFRPAGAIDSKKILISCERYQTF